VQSVTGAGDAVFGALIIGDEILSGKRQDKHLARVIQALGDRGLALAWAQYLGDDPARITATLRRTLASDDIVFCFGGIGGTPDDHTRQSAAAALGVGLVLHPEARREIEARFGAQAYPRRIAMGEFPEGARIIPNPYNRIPGFSLRRHHFLPGFPEMAWPMMESLLDGDYQALHRSEHEQDHAILVYGAGESDLVDLMEACVARFPQARLFSLPTLLPDGGRRIELGVRGLAATVIPAMAFLRDGVSARGFEYAARPDPV
jgi:molybdopterin-biosynthesis enzyme MoeA-like protein